LDYGSEWFWLSDYIEEIRIVGNIVYNPELMMYFDDEEK